MKKEKTKVKNTNKGITLIALVITIIVLLILAGVSIAMLTGENGVLTKATEAKEQTEIAQEKEEISMSYAAAKANKVAQISEDVTADELNTELDKLNSQGDADDSDGLKVTYPNGHIYEIEQSTGKITGPIGEEPPEENTAENPEYWEKTTKDDNEWYSYADTSNGNQSVKVNAPKLKGAMTPIKYVGEDKSEQTGSKWANAITQDGSMFVWIPRYAYKITKGYHTNQVGTIEVAFIDTNNNFLNGETGTLTSNPEQVTYKEIDGEQVQQEWLVHPAFTSNAENGGGFGEISGLWVGKFETTKTEDTLVVKPLQTGLVETSTVGEQYEIALEATFGETQSLNSHMAKNSEWGAIVYLAHSKYGTNGQKVEQQEEWITGGGYNSKEIYTNNKKQSTTHNAYGVYGMNGRSTEFTASYVNYSTISINIKLQNDGGSLFGKDEHERTTSTKYKTVYEASGLNQEETYMLAEEKKGDAIYETSNTSMANKGAWFEASTFFPNSQNPFFARSFVKDYSSSMFFYIADAGFRMGDRTEGLRHILVTN